MRISMILTFRIGAVQNSTGPYRNVGDSFFTLVTYSAVNLMIHYLQESNVSLM